MYHRDLDITRICLALRELFFYEYVLYTLSYVGSRDLVRQWPAVQNQNKQRFLYETFKRRWCARVRFSIVMQYQFCFHYPTRHVCGLVCEPETFKPEFISRLIVCP